MGAIFHFLIAASVGIVIFYLYVYMQKPAPKLEIDSDGWFGSGLKRPDNEKVVPFTVNVSDQALKDLNLRLANARLAHAPLEDSNNFEYGFNSIYLRKVIDYWRQKFNWRKQEAIINEFSQFKTEIEGLQIHFIHAKPPAKKYSKVIPLLIVHGWPGNVFEFYKVIPMLTDPASHLKMKTDFAFEVVAPSIPGYGWSDSPKKTGFNQWSTARIFKKLMHRLGLKKFIVQGGDWGSLVVTNIAHYYPQSVLGVHVNMIFMTPFASLKTAVLSLLGSIAPSAVFSSPSAFSFDMKKNLMTMIAESGYMHLQATKPDTIGTALNDSPIGLAAYILEKFSTWTNRRYRSYPDGGLTEKFSMDELLTIISIYWLNNNIANSVRYYKEFFLAPQKDVVMSTYLSAPMGLAAFPNDMVDNLPKEIIATMYNLTSYTEMLAGGHFAAFEEPTLLAKDVFQFVESL